MYIVVYTLHFSFQSNLKADHVNNPKKYVCFYICMCLMWFFLPLSLLRIVFNMYINRGCLANCTLSSHFLSDSLFLSLSFFTQIKYRPYVIPVAYVFLRILYNYITQNRYPESLRDAGAATPVIS